MDCGNLTSKQLVDLFNTTKELRREISAQNNDEDAGILLMLTKLMREILELHVWSLQKGKSLSLYQ